MKQLFEHIRVDAETLRFYAQCSVCGKKQYGAKIPIICRRVKTLSRCAKGKAGRLSQSAFNHAKAASVQFIAMEFNLCRNCFQWVCDNCYDINNDGWQCMNCSQKQQLEDNQNT